VTYSEIATWGHLENLTVEFLGTAELQWSQKNGSHCHCSQFTTCKVVDSEAFNVFLKISLLPELGTQVPVAEDSPSAQILPDERPVPNLSELSLSQVPPPESSPKFSSANVPSPDHPSTPTKVGAFDSADSADLKYDNDSSEYYYPW